VTSAVNDPRNCVLAVMLRSLHTGPARHILSKYRLARHEESQIAA
jgi:hypothetical protein